MNAHVHPDCYGRLFPPGHTDQTAGRVFSYTEAHPGMITGIEPIFDLAAWDRCTECPEFETCYRLSVADQGFCGQSMGRHFTPGRRFASPRAVFLTGQS